MVQDILPSATTDGIHSPDGLIQWHDFLGVAVSFDEMKRFKTATEVLMEGRVRSTDGNCRSIMIDFNHSAFHPHVEIAPGSLVAVTVDTVTKRELWSSVAEYNSRLSRCASAVVFSDVEP